MGVGIGLATQGLTTTPKVARKLKFYEQWSSDSPASEFIFYAHTQHRLDRSETTSTLAHSYV